jgi:DNA polymerase III subunit epsilon
MTKRQVFIDTETTGLSAKAGHRIVELAAVEAINGKLTGRKFHSYLNPGRDIDPYAQKVHGLSSEFLVDKPRFADVAKEFVNFVQGAECFMHNASFDTGFINAELGASGFGEQLQQMATVVCTVNLAKSRFPGAPASLDALIERAGIVKTRSKHSALEDAQLLADVYRKILANPMGNTTVSATTHNPIAQRMISASITPEKLGLEKTIELTASRSETFFYRDMHKRIIDHKVVNEKRWKDVVGPLVYVVTDSTGNIRYVGKWVTATPLYARWIRHKTIHHQESTRNLYLSELDAGRGPLAVWSVSVDELRRKLPANISTKDPKEIATGLEAIWIQRWKAQLHWNTRLEPVPSGFSDGEYWRN